MALTENTIQLVWEKGLKVDEYDPNNVRKDACGAWIVRADYGNRDSVFGWEVDHIYPKSTLEDLKVPEDDIDNIINLRPLNWRNNDSKSDNFPIYKASITSEDNRNILKEEGLEINEAVKQQILSFYSSYLPQ